MKRIFSGVQPTGTLHLGNYLGAIRNWVRLQSTFDDCIFCVVDMHAITVWQDPQSLTHATRSVTAAFIAAGIDADRAVLFNQSRVPAHAQLAWVFNCVSRMGWLNRMTQFKDKAGKNRENASVGLFAYPNLMAADILAYKATHVPVGEDQKQHLELTRDIAIKFNNDFGTDVFPVAEPLIVGDGTRVMSLREGTRKMSKSDPSDYSRLTLTDDADAIRQKIRKAKTDPDPLPETVDGLQGRPEAENLVNIYAALSDQTRDDVLVDIGGKAFSEFKTMLTDVAVSVLSPITERMNALLADPAHIDAILDKGAQRANAIAQPIIDQVYETVGFLKPQRSSARGS